MNNIFDQIIANIYTSSSLTKRLRLLRQNLNNLYFSNKTDFTDQMYIDRDDLSWLKNLDPRLLQQFNKQNMKQLLDELENEAKELSSLVIYLPVDFPNEEIDRMGQYIRQNFFKNIILDIKLDPSLLAGCALIWKGVYKDYSVRKKIDENKEAILKELKGFIA